jgi:hypothetical protein
LESAPFVFGNKRIDNGQYSRSYEAWLTNDASASEESKPYSTTLAVRDLIRRIKN